MNDFAFTSDFWSWWVIVLTVANILACWWLIAWTSKPRPGEAATGDVTGHKWDETLEEYNNPLPRWWLWMFNITLVFGLIYLVMFPGLGAFKGFLGWTEEDQYQREMDAAAARYGPIFAKYGQQELAVLAKDDEALRTGRRLFVNYCATCHGSDAGGGPGFPNLTDDNWQWGSSAAAIKTSILDGRNGVMPPWQQALGDEGVEQVTAYVLNLAGRGGDASTVSAGKGKFQAMCAACHGADGKGNPMLGAPNLTDDVWLYGGSPGAVRKSIAEGRNGVMPGHREFLGEDKVHLLAAYVYSLSQGTE